MPINVNDPEYVKAEKDYHEASSLEEKLAALKKMISHAPKHKGGENLRQQLTTRRKKLEQEIIKKKKSGKSTKIGIKKENHQVVILGKTNSGKSTLINLLTNARPTISSVKFSTTMPVVGMTNIEKINMQIIENPAIASEFFDKGLANSADAVIILINSLEELDELKDFFSRELHLTKKQIILYNDKENLNQNQLRKLNAKMKSKKYNFAIINLANPDIPSIEVIKNKIFSTFDKIRIYTKEPGREKENKPMILNQDATVKDAAEKILKGFSKNIRETKIWGPSSKFPGQVVGLNHKLKDLDTVEFKTR